MIYTITFNPSLDYVISVNEFASGKINRTTEEDIFPGGKGINVSMVLAEFGIKSTALGFVAGFTGKELEDCLLEKGIHTDFVYVKDGMTRINVKMRSELETEINGQGPMISLDELDEFMKKLEALLEEDIVILSGSISKGIPLDIYAEIVKICNRKNVRVIVDASSELLWNTLEHHPFLIKPNHHELGDIFNREFETKEEFVFYAKELQNRGARNVLVSAGSMGAVLVAENGMVYEMDAVKGEAVNTVGAGDSMIAGFLAGYMEKDDYEYALKVGICTGGATAFSKGLATYGQIQTLMENVFDKSNQNE